MSALYLEDTVKHMTEHARASIEAGYTAVKVLVVPPTAPGLGIEVDEEEAAKHPYQQEVLMQWWHPDGAVADW